MSEQNGQQRDAAGRFLRPDEPPRPLDTSEMHPAARLLFGWVSARIMPAVLLAAMVALSLGLIAADLLVERNEAVEIAGSTGFFAMFGFAAIVFAVLAAWPLGALLRRDEDFYGEGNETPVRRGDEEE